MVKNLSANAGDAGDMGLIPGSGRSPGEGNGNPLQHSWLEKFHGQRSVAGYSPCGYKELDTTELTCTQGCSVLRHSHCTRVLGRGSCSVVFISLCLNPWLLYCLHLALGHQSGNPWNSVLFPCYFLVPGVFIQLLLPPCETVRHSGISA